MNNNKYMILYCTDVNEFVDIDQAVALASLNDGPGEVTAKMILDAAEHQHPCRGLTFSYRDKPRHAIPIQTPPKRVAPAGYLTAREIAAHLGVAQSTVDVWVRDGSMPYRQTRHGRVFEIRKVDKWIKRSGREKQHDAL